MSDTPSQHRSISKSELARLLGGAESDFLTRREVAEITGLSEGTLANKAKDGPAYYRSSTSSTAGKVWYLRRDVEAFAEHRRSRIKSSYRGRLGQQDWVTLQDEFERLPVHVIVSMIAEWKDSELYRRAQAILHDPNPMAGRAKYEEECRLFGAAEQAGRIDAFASIAASTNAAARRKAIFESLDDQTNAVEAHLLALAASRGLSMSPSHPSFIVLTTMFERAWRDVLDAEMRWRNFDYTGMPSRRPLTISDVSIVVFEKNEPT